MTDHSHRMQARLAEMLEATKLTSAGRLNEATALLRGLGGAKPREAGSDHKTTDHKTIDLVAERVETTGARPGYEPRAAETTFPPILPEKVRDVVGTVVRGLRGIAPSLKGLGDKGIGDKGLGLFGLPRAPSGHVPGAGRFIAKTFSDTTGARDYKLYVPSEAEGLPLVVMLHGCSQSPDDFAAGTAMNALADEVGFLVAYPAQSARANGQRCWNWFEPRDQSRESGEAAIIAGLTRAVIADHRVDPRRIYIAGLSAGAAAAANVAHAYPDLYAAVGIHSGLAAGCARDLSSAMMAMNRGAPGAVPPNGFGAPTGGVRVPTIVVHGEGDGTVSPRNGEQILAQAGIATLERLETTPEPANPGGLASTRTRYADAEGRVQVESWLVRGLGHAWSGGDPSGSYTDPRGPDASRAMVAFFLTHALPDGRG